MEKKGGKGCDKRNRMENPSILVIRQEHSGPGDGIMCGRLLRGAWWSGSSLKIPTFFLSNPWGKVYLGFDNPRAVTPLELHQGDVTPRECVGCGEG